MINTGVHLTQLIIESVKASIHAQTWRVTLPAKEEGADVDGPEEAGGVTVLVHGCFGQSWALLPLVVATSMAYMTEK